MSPVLGSRSLLWLVPQAPAQLSYRRTLNQPLYGLIRESNPSADNRQRITRINLATRVHACLAPSSWSGLVVLDRAGSSVTSASDPKVRLAANVCLIRGALAIQVTDLSQYHRHITPRQRTKHTVCLGLRAGLNRRSGVNRPATKPKPSGALACLLLRPGLNCPHPHWGRVRSRPASIAFEVVCICVFQHNKQPRNLQLRPLGLCFDWLA